MTAFTRALATGASLIAFLPALTHAAPVIDPLIIVITPARSPVPLNQVASSMTVITPQEIEQRNEASVAELLRSAPGVTVANNGGMGQTSRLFMRGTNSNHVLVLLDGMVMNDPSDPGNAFDFANLSTDNIERIEVLRGAQSTLYGSQAIGGVINIITKEGKGKPRRNAFAEYGRYNTSRLGAGSSGEIGRTAYSLQLSNSYTSGISSYDKKLGGTEKDSSHIYTFAGNLQHRLTERFTAKLNTRYNRTNTEFDSPGGFTRPSDDPEPINDSRQVNLRGAGELTLLDGKWTQEFGVSYLHLNRAQITEYFDSMGTPFFGRQQYYGWRETLDWIHRLRVLPDHLLTIGAETFTDHLKTNQLAEVNEDSQALFADHQFNIGESFFMNNGVRLDRHQAFGRQFTWKIAPGYRIRATGTTLKGTYGTGFKAPSLSQLHDPNFGNPNLKPEKSEGWDAGFEQSLWNGKATVGATYFRNNIRQLVGFDNAPPFAAINTGKARTQGVETVATLHPSAGWDITASYVYTLAQDLVNDVDLLRRPRHQANLGATWRYKAQGDVGAQLRYSSYRRDFDIAFPFGRVYVKSFTTLDLNTNYHLTPAITLYGRLENVFDKRYQEVYAYGQPGMALYAGVKTAF